MNIAEDMTAERIIDAIDDAGFDIGVSRYGHLIWSKGMPPHLVKTVWDHEAELVAYILEEAPAGWATTLAGDAAEKGALAAERKAAVRAKLTLIPGGRQ